ncbi:hypothetical protein CERZMDRAFT_51794 [Cercospora zeae-maydis SCOH1-5]|uniref:Uncharacterized protein n=1 Tax=Cercospora zeae-maydis SCOH1-5 TaxID=717836 RepID=A0A6A6EZY8_9PEZI|nr:hypothetical protein CERZMDRAFT_51794 [Cercospora zeae-maydis SCOH1-5]
MPRILITGSASGLGLLSAQALAARGHEVHLHARTASRAQDAKAACPSAKSCYVAELSSLSEVKKLASEINQTASTEGPWDAIIHNAGVMHGVSGKNAPEGDYGLLFATNTLAPYVISSLVKGGAKRHVFLGSQMHAGGDASLKNLRHCGYGDSKLHDIMLAFAFAERLKDDGVEECNALDPGWVPTNMGGSSAPDSIDESVQTYVALAEGVGSSGEYFGPAAKKGRRVQPAAKQVEAQEKLLAQLAEISGVPAPGS